MLGYSMLEVGYSMLLGYSMLEVGYSWVKLGIVLVTVKLGYSIVKLGIVLGYSIGDC